ncbi:MAG: ABC transporter ATP-binding protein [Lachnospiraceae bacterium]
MKHLFAFAGKYHRMTILACVLTGISTVLSMIPFVCIWFVVRDMLSALKQGNIALAVNTGTYAWMAFGFSAASIVVYFAALNFSHLAAFRTAKNMKKEVMHHIVTLPLGYFSRNASGRLRKIIDDNAGLTEGFLAHQLPDLTGAVVMPVATLVLLFSFDWRMGLCCMIPLGLSVVYLRQMMGGKNADFMSGYMMALETMNKEAVEYIRGIPVVKVFQQTVYSFKNFHEAIEEYRRFASGYALSCRIPLTAFQVTLNGTYLLLIPVALLIIGGVSDEATYTEAVLNFLFYSLFTPVCATMMNRVMFASEQLMAAKAAVSRIMEILQEKPLEEPSSPQKPLDYSITFDQVSFLYPGNPSPALENVSFRIGEGQTVALVGASGSGKSTAAGLMARFFDVQKGSVQIGGTDVRDIAGQDLMELIGFVFQGTRLFQASLLDNVRMAKTDASVEAVKSALAAVQCEEIVERLPEGLDTMVGTGGTYLSGGEAQRIALARTVLKDAPIVILDEATAFADAENEHKIQLAFEALARDKTVLMIAHRLSTVKNADQILVFAGGRIAEQGTHEELLALRGIYSEMWSDYQTSLSWKVGEEDTHG